LLDVRQAEQLVYAAAAAIPGTERRIEQQENFISTINKPSNRAFRDVSDALVGYRKIQAFRIQQEQLTHSAEEATKLSTMRYKGGATSYLEVLDSDTRYFAAQLNLAQADLKELQAFVDLYRALGGGWE
jgi:multidrug efflux system outer membrane protein